MIPFHESCLCPTLALCCDLKPAVFRCPAELEAAHLPQQLVHAQHFEPGLWHDNTRTLGPMVSSPNKVAEATDRSAGSMSVGVREKSNSGMEREVHKNAQNMRTRGAVVERGHAAMHLQVIPGAQTSFVPLILVAWSSYWGTV